MQRNKRLRVFAGPNGSGKSSLFDEFKKLYDPGYFINADNLEKLLSTKRLIDLNDIGIKAGQQELEQFSKTKTAKSLLIKSASDGYVIDIAVRDNFIVGKTKDTHSYEASYTAAFIRWLLYKKNKSFSFETVMKDPSKVQELKDAQKKGYKTYLYFICTDDPELNVSRVADRVEKGGHKVDPEKIRSRYPGTLSNLYPAIRYSNRAFLFDNSGKKFVLIAEVFEGTLQLKVNSPPQWFIEFVLPHYQ